MQSSNSCHCIPAQFLMCLTMFELLNDCQCDIDPFNVCVFLLSFYFVHVHRKLQIHLSSVTLSQPQPTRAWGDLGLVWSFTGRDLSHPRRASPRVQNMTLRTRSTFLFSPPFRVVLIITRLVLLLLLLSRPWHLGSKLMLNKSRPMPLPSESTWWARITSLLQEEPRTTLFCGISGLLVWLVWCEFSQTIILIVTCILFYVFVSIHL